MMSVPRTPIIASTTMAKMWARRTSGAATLTRPARPTAIQRRIGDSTKTRPPRIKHMQRPGVAASTTLLAVTAVVGWGCWPYDGGVNQPGVPGVGNGAGVVLPALRTTIGRSGGG